MKKGLFSFLLIFSILFFDNNSNAQWSYVGARGFTANSVGPPAFTFDNNDVPYVAYRDFANLDKINVMKFNGTQWVNVGPNGISSGRGKQPDLAFDSNNTPYVIYGDFTNNWKAVVMKFDGNNWVYVGSSNGISLDQADYTKIDVYNDTLFISFNDHNKNGKLSVMKYAGTSWSYVGGQGISPKEATSVDMAINSSGDIYVSFINGKTNSDRISVMKYNGASWDTLGMHSFGGKHETSIALNNSSIPHVTTPLTNGHVRFFNGNHWDTLGSYNFLSFQVKHPSLAIDNKDNVHIAFANTGSNPKLSVMRYTGSSWVYVGSDRFSDGDVADIELAINKSNIVHVGYRDIPINHKMSVMRYDCPYMIPQIQICAVTADTASGSNKTLVFWDKTSSQHVDSFIVYLDSNNTDKYRGSISINATSQYIDNSANQNLQSYSYKLITLDSCNREMPLDSSIAHKTIHLTFNYLSSNNHATILWTPYEGFQVNQYYIERKNGSNTFQLIDSIPGTAPLSYTDTNVPTSGSNRYRVYAKIPNGGCDIGTGIQQTRTYSNSVTAWNTSIAGTTKGNDLSVHPNPAHNEIIIRSASEIKEVRLYNIEGKLLKSYSNKRSKNMKLDISFLSSGTYNLSITSEKHELKNVQFQKL